MSRGIERLETDKLLDGVGATGAGTAKDVRDYTDVVFGVATDGGADANLTVKFQISYEETEPSDWASGPTVSNMWEYAAVYDLNDPSSVVTGDTGFVVAGADDYKYYVLNVPFPPVWVNARVTARSAGEVTVFVHAGKQV